MSNTEHTAAHAVTPGDHTDRTDRTDRVDDDHSRLTVEDGGSTTDPADLVDDDAASGTSGASGAATSSTGTERHGLADIDDDGSIGHVFDQTNGVIEGVDGDSDGTAASDVRSGAERDEAGTLDGAEPLGRDATGTMRRDPED
ncbi:hypothetical protein GCM10025783_30870 [Amnibacterium soli]|uniref:Chemotaxis protein n=1 Tax=Amnibacterium soli TaxID=1282736 RepID=A0ABP8ZFS5_9MICO